MAQIQLIDDFSVPHFCDECDTTQGPFYWYQVMDDVPINVLCEDCLPRCQNDDCEELALSEEHDFCESCNEKIVAEEEGAS